MAAPTRGRYISIGVPLALAVLMLDRLVASPFLEWRQELIHQRDVNARQLVEAHYLLDHEKHLRELVNGLSGSVATDASGAEGRLLQQVHDWEQQAGTANGSFERWACVDEQGFGHLKFHVAAAGKMGSVAILLYRLETASIPLRIDDMHMAPGKEGGDDLLVHFTVSTLCHSSTTKRAEPHLASAPQTNQGRG